MNGRRLQDSLYMGLGLAARHIGRTADAFRPSGPLRPLATQNRYLRLPATFTSSYGKFTRAAEYGNALWFGIFDASYTRTGDYLVFDDAVFFIASQAPMLPVLCVRTNRTVSIAQPKMQTSVAANSYGGYTSGTSVALMEEWPASIIGENRTGHSAFGLPADLGTPYWNVLIPSPAGIILSPGDIITDDLGRTALVCGSELTDLGWRLSAKMAAS